MSTLKELIEQVENHTSEKFDLSNRRHFIHLDTKIRNLHKEDLRVLNLIKLSMGSAAGSADAIYDSHEHYLQKRHK